LSVRTRWHAAPMESGGTDTATPDRAPRLRYATVLTTLPALTAIVLGLLYTIGALVRTAELRGAGMTVRDTITLVPIEQHLARGLAVVLSPATLLLVAVAVAGGLFFAWVLPKLPRWRATKRGLALAIASVAGLGLFGFYRPLAALGVLLAAAAVFGVLAATGAPFSVRVPPTKFAEGLTPLTSVAAFLVATGILAVGEALIDPAPLPRAHLDLEGGKDASGGLITVNGGVWYLDTGEDRLRAIPGSAVVASEIRSRQRPRDEKRTEQSLPTLLGAD
jgi:hypothetical protein